MDKKWGRKIDRLLSFVIIGILLPLFVTVICQRMQLEEIIYGEMQTGAYAGTGGSTGESGAKESSGSAGAGGAKESSAVEAERIEAQVTAIVAREIAADANREAILAQCVIARTNLYDAREKQLAEPAAMDAEEMRRLWGDNFEEIYRKIEGCAAETAGQVLMWNGDYIYAAYHAISAGRTRDMSKLYGEANMPYLTERLCKEDVVAENGVAVSYLRQEEFLNKCREAFPEAAIESVSEIQIVSRDETGYVQELMLGNLSCQGEKFRSLLGLASACFTITELEDQVRIVTKGLGHGFGLSQNTAGVMAEEGADYMEILEYFYPGTELTRAKP